MIFNQWIFLEMRVNINSVIPLSILAGLAVYHCADFDRINSEVLYSLRVPVISTLYGKYTNGPDFYKIHLPPP